MNELLNLDLTNFEDDAFKVIDWGQLKVKMERYVLKGIFSFDEYGNGEFFEKLAEYYGYDAIAHLPVCHVRNRPLYPLKEIMDFIIRNPNRDMGRILRTASEGRYHVLDRVIKSELTRGGLLTRDDIAKIFHHRMDYAPHAPAPTFKIGSLSVWTIEVVLTVLRKLKEPCNTNGFGIPSNTSQLPTKYARRLARLEEFYADTFSVIMRAEARAQIKEIIDREVDLDMTTLVRVMKANK